MKSKEKNQALVLIDLQQGFKQEAYWGGNRNNPEMEKKLEELLKLWRDLELPVIHVKHMSTNKNSLLHKSNEGNKLMEDFRPLEGEPLFKKKVNGAFIGTKLKKYLKKEKITRLVFGGLTTNHCISTSVRMAGNYGFEAYVLSDGTATFDRKGVNGEVFSAQLMHDTCLASLHHEFAEVVTIDEVFNWFTKE